MNTARDIPGNVSDHSAQPPVCAIVVTFFPDEGLGARIARIAAQCDRVIIVDNGSDAGVFPLPDRQVEVMRQHSNLGLAAGFNIGLRRAIALGYAWAMTFDQDSMPGADMVQRIWTTHEHHPDAAVVGPCIVEQDANKTSYRWLRHHPVLPGLFQRVGCVDRDRTDVTLLISSGSMVDLRVWTELGGFDEGLFIDYVDTDYCLRVLRSGRVLAVSATAELEHRIGARRRARLLGIGFRPMHHPVLRHYYIARNRVRVWRRHALAVPHWALFDLSFAAHNTLRVLVFEADKVIKLKAFMLGMWDGLLGRSGSCPERRLRMLRSNTG